MTNFDGKKLIALNDLVERQAEFLKALAHPSRLSLVRQLLDGERCVCELTADTELEQANVSQHLAVLRTQGIVESRREGTKIIYRLKRPEVKQILAMVAKALEAQIREDGAVLRALRQEAHEGGGLR